MGIVVKFRKKSGFKSILSGKSAGFGENMRKNFDPFENYRFFPWVETHG